MKMNRIKLILCAIALVLTSPSSWARTETVTMQYTGTESVTMNGLNQADLLGLDNNEWKVTGQHAGDVSSPVLKNNLILLNGNNSAYSSLIIENKSNKIINSIVINFASTINYVSILAGANPTEILHRGSVRDIIQEFSINNSKLYINFKYYNSSIKRIDISSIVITYEVPDAPITPEEPEATELNLVARTDANYYATFSNEKKVFFKASEATVNTVSVDSNGRLVIEPLTQESGTDNADGYYVPKATGVLIQSERAEGDEGNGKTIHYYTVEEPELILQEAEDPLSGNMLKAASVPMEQESYKFYRLAYNNFTEKTGLGFYYGSGCDNGQPFNCKAGTAYLAVPIAQEAAAPQARINYIIEATEETNTATFIEEQPTEEDCKFIENGQLFIRKNGVVYNAMGLIVR